MGRKRKNSAAAVVERPIFCFYCDRTFADETTLIVHQKGKHFKCTECSKRLNSVGGCAIHLLQVHRIEIKSVPNAKEGRGGLEWEVFGMAGVPDGMMPGGPVPEEVAAAKAQKTGNAHVAPGQDAAASGQAHPGQYYHGGQYPPPGSAPYSSGMPFPMMPPPQGFPPMIPGSYGMMAPPGMPPPGMPPSGMLPPPYGFRPPPSSTFATGQQPPPTLQPPHAASPWPGSSMPPGSMPPGCMPPGWGSGPLPDLHPHSSGPLFPLDLLKPEVSAAAVPAPESTIPGVPGSPDVVPMEAPLVWTDERFSMEERRAQMVQNGMRPLAPRPTSFAAAPALHQSPHQPPYQPPPQPPHDSSHQHHRQPPPPHQQQHAPLPHQHGQHMQHEQHTQHGQYGQQAQHKQQEQHGQQAQYEQRAQHAQHAQQAPPASRY